MLWRPASRLILLDVVVAVFSGKTSKVLLNVRERDASCPHGEAPRVVAVDYSEVVAPSRPSNK